MKFAASRPFADPDTAARKLIEIASTIEPVYDGRIYIELLNGSFLFSNGGSPEEYGAGIKARLANDARKRDLCEIHASRCGPVRVATPCWRG